VGLEIGVFYDFLCSDFTLSVVLGLDFLRASLRVSRPHSERGHKAKIVLFLFCRKHPLLVDLKRAVKGQTRGQSRRGHHAFRRKS
jgi:hypothetical protein